MSSLRHEVEGVPFISTTSEVLNFDLNLTLMLLFYKSGKDIVMAFVGRKRKSKGNNLFNNDFSLLVTKTTSLLNINSSFLRSISQGILSPIFRCQLSLTLKNNTNITEING